MVAQMGPACFVPDFAGVSLSCAPDSCDKRTTGSIAQLDYLECVWFHGFPHALVFWELVYIDVAIDFRVLPRCVVLQVVRARHAAVAATRESVQ